MIIEIDPDPARCENWLSVQIWVDVITRETKEKAVEKFSSDVNTILQSVGTSEYLTEWGAMPTDFITTPDKRWPWSDTAHQ